MKTTKQNHCKFILNVFIFLLLTSTFLLFNSCNTTEPPPPEKPKLVELKEITESCTETFIKVTVKDTILPVSVKITRDGKEIMSFYQTKTDTTIIDTGLAAGKTYTYQPAAEVNGKEEVGKEIQVSTLPTTSDNFTWKTYAFGDFKYGSSNLSDVAIIDENDIWAVGEIHADTTGQAYNAVHWDGNKWKLRRITTKFHGYDITVSLEGIHSFSKNDIWFVGSLPIHWDGVNAIMYDLRTTTDPNLSLSKAWGKNTNDMYFVGRKGSIAHYNGTSWSKIESGTTTNINDVWGYYNQSSNEEFVLCVASNILHQGEYRLLAISDGNAHDTLNWTYNNYWLKTVWFKDKYSPIYIAGGGIKLYKRNHWEEQHVTNNFVESIRGSEVNNIFAVGDNGFVGHFNGIGWHVFNDLYNNSVLLSASVKNKTTVIVGYTFSGSVGDKAIIIIGKRND